MAAPNDFSKTKRIVLLVDLTPLLSSHTSNPNPNPYLTSLLTASKRLISFPSLSSSLFAFKFFFSSLSPLRSSSLLPCPHSSSLSFNHPSETLNSLSSALSSLSIPPQFDNSPPRASFISSSLIQLLHDYAWDESGSENLSGKCSDLFLGVRSNLIILMSPIPRSVENLSEFMGLDFYDNENLDQFVVRFCKNFDGVKDAFDSRDIHFSWIDAKLERKCNNEEMGQINESGTQVALLLEKGIMGLGWGFCSTDLIVLGSPLIPFGLMYPKIGTSFNFLKCNKFNKSTCAQLSLEISDVSGKPLECKCCDVELLNLKLLSSISPSEDNMDALKVRDSEGEGFASNDALWGHFGDGTVKMHVKAVCRYNEVENFERCSHNQVLVRACSGEIGKSRKKSADEFFTDRVLDIVSREMGECILKNSIPIWQILISFLYREGCWAFVSLSNSRQDEPSMGILKPLTAHLAVLGTIDKEDFGIHELCGSNLANIDDGNFKTSAAPTHSKPGQAKVNMEKSNTCMVSQTETLTSANIVPPGDGKRKKNKEVLRQDLTWSSFLKAAFECSDFDLAEVYFARDVTNSKKLKFLKCWMKQVKKSSGRCQTASKEFMSQECLAKETDRGLNVNHESEQLAALHFPSEPSRMQEGVASVPCLETAEDFFNNLPTKIEQGIESGVDLQSLAERLVSSTIHRLSRKCAMDNNLEGQTTMVKSADLNGKVLVADLIELLLREPKELKEKRNIGDQSIEASDQGSAPETILREYELQIFFRMELLRSEVAESIEETEKQELVRQICSFLEIIQYLVEGGFHGHVSLHDYVERTIKTRYCHTLEDVVQRIYIEMDLLLFADEIEPPSSLFNSEDSNQSWKDKQERYEVAVTNKTHELASAEDDSAQLPEDHESPQGVKKEEQAHKLSQAHERRERSRRFASFTSWKPDLQRVWAPKQPTGLKVNSESLQKESKRKEREKTGYSNIVCETPVTGKRRPFSRESNIKDQKVEDDGGNSTSVSRALFQDD